MVDYNSKEGRFVAISFQKVVIEPFKWWSDGTSIALITDSFCSFTLYIAVSSAWLAKFSNFQRGYIDVHTRELDQE